MATTKGKKNQTAIHVVFSIILIVFVYSFVQLILFLRQPANSTLVRNGELVNSEEFVGYIIRDEEIVDTSEYTGVSSIVITDENRVPKGGTIISYVSNEQEALMSKIGELDAKIQEAMENKPSIYSPDVKNLEADIQDKLYKLLARKSDVYEVYEYKTAINESIEKKAKIVGELSPAGSKIKELISERMKYEIELNESNQELKATKSGLVSYRVDNYENILTPNSFSSLSIAELEKIKINVGQVIPINTNKVKIVNNFECFIAIPMDAEKTETLSLNSIVKLRFDNTDEDYVKSTVEYISEEENNKKLVIFKVPTNTEALTKYRKINLEIIWWSDNGLKVPNDAIKYVTLKNEQTGQDIATIPMITIIESAYQEEAWVKVIRSTDKFSIVENYTDEELVEMGFTEEMLENRTDIKMYDEILVN
ncbi:MAG: hypothetical protein J6B87_03715 [Clostridia bacterium]|nr:hypothetical protein [Clostridia bacterium]